MYQRVFQHRLACFADADEKSKRKTKGRAAIDEAMHVVKESMNDIGGLGHATGGGGRRGGGGGGGGRGG